MVSARHSISRATHSPIEEAAQKPRMALDLPPQRERRTAAADVKAALNGLGAATRAADEPPAGEQPATPHHHGNLLPSENILSKHVTVYPDRIQAVLPPALTKFYICKKLRKPGAATPSSRRCAPDVGIPRQSLAGRWPPPTSQAFVPEAPS